MLDASGASDTIADARALRPRRAMIGARASAGLDHSQRQSQSSRTRRVEPRARASESGEARERDGVGAGSSERRRKVERASSDVSHARESSAAPLPSRSERLTLCAACWALLAMRKLRDSSAWPLALLASLDVDELVARTAQHFAQRRFSQSASASLPAIVVMRGSTEPVPVPQ